MKLPDDFIDLMGELYRAMCGPNDILIVDGWIITFAEFLEKVSRRRFPDARFAR